MTTPLEILARNPESTAASSVRPLLGLVLTAVLFVGSDPAHSASAPILRAADAIPGRYVVVLKSNVVRPLGESAVYGPSVSELAGTLSMRHGFAVGRTFERTIQGFAVRMSATQASAMAQEPSVAYIAEDGWVGVASSQTNPPSWGLDRVDQRALPLDATFTYSTSASEVDLYVVDSGVRSSHLEFGGRVDTAGGFTTILDGGGTEDCNGHGTLVAGIAAGATFGVAKGVSIHPVRVVACNGWGSSSDLIAGVEWITQRFQATHAQGAQKGGDVKSVGRPAVVNMSLNGMKLQPVDDAVRASIAAGVTYVLAAGNDAWNACSFSPSGVTEAIVVGGTDESDQFYADSNTGSCVDLLAPAVNVPSSFIRSDTDTLALTGTSAAAPFVAGVAALFLTGNPAASPAEVQSAILAGASVDLITGVPAATANLLAFSAFAGGDALPVPAFSVRCKGPWNCTFDGSASTDDEGIKTYSWDFGDGSVASGARIWHVFPQSGSTFAVTLTVRDTAGQTSSLQQVVRF